MVMNILIEGIDCAGKSTLAKELKNALGWDTRSLHHGKGNQFLRYLKEYASTDCTIFERGHVSEIVYGKLFKRKNPFTKSEEKILNAIIGETGIIISCIPPLGLALERYRSRKHVRQIVKEKEIIAGRKIFMEYFHKNRDWRLIRYYSKSFAELDSVIRKVKLILKNS